MVSPSSLLFCILLQENKLKPTIKKDIFLSMKFNLIVLLIVNSGILETDMFDSENKQFSIVFVAFSKSTTFRRQAATNDCETYKIL